MGGRAIRTCALKQVRVAAERGRAERLPAGQFIRSSRGRAIDLVRARIVVGGAATGFVGTRLNRGGSLISLAAAVIRVSESRIDLGR